MEHQNNPQHHSLSREKPLAISGQPAAEEIQPFSTKNHESVLRMQRIIGNQAVQRVMLSQQRASASSRPLIQRRGTYVPLNIVQAGNNQAIEEQEYGQAANIALTNITSCVGFIARVNNQIFGIHLGVIDENENQVTAVDKQLLRQALENVWPANPDVVVQVGMANNWNGDVMQKSIFPVVYTDEFHQVDGGGVYSAIINVQNKLVVSKDGNVAFTEP